MIVTLTRFSCECQWRRKQTESVWGGGGRQTYKNLDKPKNSEAYDCYHGNINIVLRRSYDQRISVYAEVRPQLIKDILFEFTQIVTYLERQCKLCEQFIHQIECQKLNLNQNVLSAFLRIVKFHEYSYLTNLQISSNLNCSNNTLEYAYI